MTACGITFAQKITCFGTNDVTVDDNSKFRAGQAEPPEGKFSQVHQCHTHLDGGTSAIVSYVRSACGDEQRVQHARLTRAIGRFQGHVLCQVTGFELT